MSSSNLSYWAIAQTESQREVIAAYFLSIAKFETYLPRIKINRGRKSRVVPLFPSYLFVRVLDQWRAVESTIGVTRMIVSGGAPARMRDEELNKIRAREVNGIVRLPKPPKRFEQGDRLAIVKGSFRGHACLFEGMSTHDRVAVLMDLLGRKVKLELATSDVAPEVQHVVAL
jgi:transcriptional antiterminator RfaH